MGFDIRLADARKVKSIAPLACETDRVDARVLADLVRRDLMPEVWVPDLEERAIRERLRRRSHLIRLRTSAMNRSVGLLTQWGLRRNLTALRKPDAMPQLAQHGVPDVWLRSITTLLAVIEDLDRQLAVLDGDCSASRAPPRSATSRASPAHASSSATPARRRRSSNPAKAHAPAGCPRPARTRCAGPTRSGKRSNHMQFPPNMKFARAMSNGVGLHCPDLTAGTPVYTPDGLGGEEPDSDVAPEPEPVGEEPGETLVVLEAADRTAHERLSDVASECGYTAATLSCAGSSATGTTSSS